MSKILKTNRAGFFKKIPFKPKETLTSGVINMRILLKPILCSIIIFSMTAPVWADTPVSVEEKKTTDIKSEAKKINQKLKKSRFATLPNGQKVKIFSGPVNEMPKEVGIVYTTEDGYKKMLQEIKENSKKSKIEKQIEVEKTLPAKNIEHKEAVKATPIVIAEPIESKSEVVPVVIEQPSIKALPPAVPVTPIVLEPVKEITQDPAVEVKPIDVSTLPPAPTPVKAQEVSDPIPMVQQHPTPIVIQSSDKKVEEIAKPVDMSKDKKETLEIAAPKIQENEKKIEVVVNKSLEKDEIKKAQETPITIAPVAIEQKNDASKNIPKVSISVEQRNELKKQLAEEFNNISIEQSDAKLSSKVLEEQKKVEEVIQVKVEEEKQAKEKAEAEAKAVQAAKDEKEYRENAPLAEDSQAEPAKAYTEEELKPIRLDKKNKNIVIELPKQRLNAYLTGSPMPTVDSLENQQKEEQQTKSQRLEEDSELEEVSGPNYSNINN